MKHYNQGNSTRNVIILIAQLVNNTKASLEQNPCKTYRTDAVYLYVDLMDRRKKH